MVNFDGGALKRKNGETDSTMETANLFTPPCSPASHANGNFVGGMVKLTPTLVRTGLNAANWLQTIISPLPSKPSAELEKLLLLCNSNIVNEVIRRANIVLGAIFPSIESGQRHVALSLLNVNLMDSLWSGQERIEAMKLYYKVLESICTSEAEKLSTRDLSSLLTNEKFHRCMLACAAELVSAAHVRGNILFPLVLERTGITAFDMSKVIESFIKHEDSLPRELKRHLNSLEEKLLESMVWEKGSSLYNSLIVTRPDLSDEIKRLKLLAEPMPSLDEIAISNHVPSGGLPHQQILHKHKSSVGQDGAKRICKSSASEIKDGPPASDGFQTKLPPASPSLQTAFVSPTQAKTPNKGATLMNAAISVLFNKMNKLAAVRINCMAERLKLSQQIREKIYLLFQRILTQKTHLFFNRHIDQIIRCCFYVVVAKIFNLELTFEEINKNYIKQTQCRSQDFCGVFVSWSSRCNGKNGENHVSIITFYNKIFIPNVKSLLEEIGYARASLQVPELNNNNNDSCPNSPRASLFPSLPDISPKKVSPSQNVYLSPLRSSKRDALNSNVGKSYYAFIGESTCEYQSPSKELEAINECLNSNNNRKRRRMLNFDDPSVTLISDSVVAMSLFPQNGKYS